MFWRWCLANVYPKEIKRHEKKHTILHNICHKSVLASLYSAERPLRKAMNLEKQLWLWRDLLIQALKALNLLSHGFVSPLQWPKHYESAYQCWGTETKKHKIPSSTVGINKDQQNLRIYFLERTVDHLQPDVFFPCLVLCHLLPGCPLSSIWASKAETLTRKKTTFRTSGTFLHLSYGLPLAYPTTRPTPLRSIYKYRYYPDVSDLESMSI